MINLLQDKNSFVPSINLQYNNKKLKMFLKENYLEWTFKSLGGDNTFIITMEDYEIYETFLKLYSDIKFGNIFTEDEASNIYDGYYNQLLDLNSEITSTIMYKKLFKNEAINYKSDNSIGFEQVTITKGEDYFKLEFNSSKPSNCKRIIFNYPTINLLACSSPFIRQFNELLNINLDYHQINLYDLTKVIV